MDLSIVIVNYNTKKLIVQCIESIIKTKGNLEFEIIVVDNASSDGSFQELENLQKKLSNLRLIENKRNLGFAKANNIGIKTSKGKYILLLNSDTKVKRGSLQKLVGFAKKTQDAGVVAPRLYNPNNSIQASCFNFPDIQKAIAQYWLGKKGLLDKFYPKSEKPVCVDAVVGAAFLITPHARKRVGLLDERYFMYFEDIDYCRKVWRAGLKVYYLPQAGVIHHHGQSGKKIGETQRMRLVKSSISYHGVFRHTVINLIIRLGQKWQRLLKNQK
jgi:GT2 family glycosyltransferase